MARSIGQSKQIGVGRLNLVGEIVQTLEGGIGEC